MLNNTLLIRTPRGTSKYVPSIAPIRSSRLPLHTASKYRVTSFRLPLRFPRTSPAFPFGFPCASPDCPCISPWLPLRFPRTAPAFLFIFPDAFPENPPLLPARHHGSFPEMRQPLPELPDVLPRGAPTPCRGRCGRQNPRFAKFICGTASDIRKKAVTLCPASGKAARRKQQHRP